MNMIVKTRLLRSRINIYRNTFESRNQVLNSLISVVYKIVYAVINKNKNKLERIPYTMCEFSWGVQLRCLIQ